MTPREQAMFAYKVFRELSASRTFTIDDRETLLDLIEREIKAAIREARKSERERCAQKLDQLAASAREYAVSSRGFEAGATAIRSLPEDPGT